jgi:hypothetical protein
VSIAFFVLEESLEMPPLLLLFLLLPLLFLLEDNEDDFLGMLPIVQYNI